MLYHALSRCQPLPAKVIHVVVVVVGGCCRSRSSFLAIVLSYWLRFNLVVACFDQKVCWCLVLLHMRQFRGDRRPLFVGVGSPCIVLQRH